MLYNIKQAGGLKASRMHEKLGLGWPSLVYLTTSKAAKQPTGKSLIALKTFLKI